MQDLQTDLAAVLMNSVGNPAQFPRLRVFGEDWPAWFDQTCCVRRVAAGDYQPNLPLCPLGEKHRHSVQSILLHIEAGVH